MADAKYEPKPPTKSRWKKGQSGNPGGRKKRDAILDEFFEEVVRGQTKDGQPFAVERRRALLERLYTSAMDTRRKDHGRLLEVVCAYYFGKPRERLEMSGPGGGPIESADATPRRRPTTGELRKELEAILAKRAAFMAAKAAAAETNGAANGNGVHHQNGTDDA